MIPAEVWIAGIVLAALILYAVTGGADFGGGVWDLFASGRAASRQRELIAHAIGPIWEANHVWLILVVVLLFVCFPIAFAAITTALHIPLTLMLIGIVLRGTAFTFRSYDRPDDPVQRRWSRVFAIASLLTPITLGITVGAIASGRIEVDPASGWITTDFFASWLHPFPFVVGLFALALFAFLAAVYLILETRDRELREQFRRRALMAAVAVGVIAWIAFALAARGAPRIHEGLAQSWWAPPFHIVTGAVALGVISSLITRRYVLARFLAIVQVGLVLCGWAFAQYPYLVVPRLHLLSAAAPLSVLRPVLIALAVGAVVLVPALIYLFRLFKGHRDGTEEDGATS